MKKSTRTKVMAGILTALMILPTHFIFAKDEGEHPVDSETGEEASVDQSDKVKFKTGEKFDPETVKAEDLVENADELLAKGFKFTFELGREPKPGKTGDSQEVVVETHFPDGTSTSSTIVSFIIKNQPMKDKYKVEFKKGNDAKVDPKTVEAKDLVKNLGELPTGTKFTFGENNKPKPGKPNEEQSVSVITTYPDGTSSETFVNIKVLPNSENENYKVKFKRNEEVDPKTVEAKDLVENVDELLAKGYSFTFGQTPKADEGYDPNVSVITTYPDGSHSETIVPVNVIKQEEEPAETTDSEETTEPEETTEKVEPTKQEETEKPTEATKPGKATEASKKAEEAKKDDVTKTGEGFGVYSAIGVTLIALGIALAIMKKKNRNLNQD